MKKLKVDIGAENTFTKTDLNFMIAVINSSDCAGSQWPRSKKCVRLLEAALKKLEKK